MTPVTEILLDDDGINDVQLAHIFVAGSRGAQLLTASDSMQSDGPSANDTTGTPDVAVITMISGEMFINPLKKTIIKSPVGEVQIKKGALVSVSLEAGRLRVTACSGPGDVSVVIPGGKDMAVNAGQEVVLSAEMMTADESKKADGVGRRDVRVHRLASTFVAVSDVSIVTMMANLPHMQVLSRPSTQVERKIADRMLKAAAAIHQITQRRGSYQAIPSASPAARNHRQFLPVSFAP